MSCIRAAALAVMTGLVCLGTLAPGCGGLEPDEPPTSSSASAAALGEGTITEGSRDPSSSSLEGRGPGPELQQRFQLQQQQRLHQLRQLRSAAGLTTAADTTLQPCTLAGNACLELVGAPPLPASAERAPDDPVPVADAPAAGPSADPYGDDPIPLRPVNPGDQPVDPLGDDPVPLH